jgi:hypothetical protein
MSSRNHFLRLLDLRFIHPSRLTYSEFLPLVRAFQREYLVVKGLLDIHSAQESSDAMMQYEHVPKLPRQKGSRFKQFTIFAFGIWTRAHVRSGAGEN